MTGKKLILDTNIVIELFRGNKKVLSVLSNYDVIYLPITVLGELYLGAYRSLNIQKKLEEIKRFVKSCSILDSDTNTADNYGAIKSGLLNIGKPLPENDIWIAAISIQYDLPLYTLDNHFNEIEGLKIIKW